MPLVNPSLNLLQDITPQHLCFRKVLGYLFLISKTTSEYVYDVRTPDMRNAEYASECVKYNKLAHVIKSESYVGASENANFICFLRNDSLNFTALESFSDSVLSSKTFKYSAKHLSTHICNLTQFLD